MTRITIGPTYWKLSDIIPAAPLGSSLEGGYIICKSGGTAWIVSPRSAEVSRTWYDRDDAVTTANANAACGDWFVPTCGQLKNPGYTCRTYWDSWAFKAYWSSTENNFSSAVYTHFSSGLTCNRCKLFACCVRAFRCVTY